jgi:hypothetical protein
MIHTEIKPTEAADRLAIRELVDAPRPALRGPSVPSRKFGGTESGHWWMLRKDAGADA